MKFNASNAVFSIVTNFKFIEKKSVESAETQNNILKAHQVFLAKNMQKSI